MWTKLTNLKHLEICDFPDDGRMLPFCPKQRCDSGSCGKCLATKYSDFIINRNTLEKLTTLETLKLGLDADLLRLAECKFQCFPNLMKLSFYPQSASGCFYTSLYVFERDLREKAEGRARIEWFPPVLEDGERMWEIPRHRYEGEVDEKKKIYEMNGRGVLYYRDDYRRVGRDSYAKRFEGTFKDNVEIEGTIYYSDGKEYKGKFINRNGSDSSISYYYDNYNNY